MKKELITKWESGTRLSELAAQYPSYYYYWLIIIQYFYVYIIIRSRVSVVGIATGYGLDDRGVGVRVPVESRISPNRPDRLWGLPNLLSNGYRGISLQG
jgi:hypothetical protein